MVYYLYFDLDFPSQINCFSISVTSSVIKSLLLRIKSFKNTFFPYCINEWNNLTVEIRNSRSISTLKKSINCGKKKKTQFMIHSVLNSLPALDFNLAI